MSALDIAVTALKAFEATMSVRANNVANSKTIGFKKFAVYTNDLHYKEVQQPTIAEEEGAISRPAGTYIGMGSKISATNRILTQGDVKQTDNKLDLMIVGSGYIALAAPNGNVGYTRNGALMRNNEGRLVHTNGAGLERNIVIPPEIPDANIFIGDDGMVSYKDIDGVMQEVDTIPIYSFVNEGGLTPGERSMVYETEASGAPIEGIAGEDGFGSIKSGYLEESNVSPIDELTSLMEAQRGYEMASKVMEIYNKATDSIINVK